MSVRTGQLIAEEEDAAIGAGAVIAVASSLPAVPERLSTLDQLAAGWLLRFGPNTRDAYARDLRSWVASCDELGWTGWASGCTTPTRTAVG